MQQRKAWLGVQEFAEFAGVTVRTLHHYDHLGLLKPRKRSAAGYRLYQAEDLERVEQIAALKFLGLLLAEIRRVLEQGPVSLIQELTRQQAALVEKRRFIDHALTVIDEAQLALRQGKPPATLLRRIIEAMTMENSSDWMMRYYSPEAQAKLAERGKTFTPEMQEQISQAWKDYYRDAAMLHEQDDPDGSRAAALAERHRELVAAFTGNDPEVEAGLMALYRDRANWPSKLEDRVAAHENGQRRDV